MSGSRNCCNKCRDIRIERGCIWSGCRESVAGDRSDRGDCTCGEIDRDISIIGGDISCSDDQAVCLVDRERTCRTGNVCHQRGDIGCERGSIDCSDIQNVAGDESCGGNASSGGVERDIPRTGSQTSGDREISTTGERDIEIAVIR